MKLYEILVPDSPLELHLGWDAKVIKITNGLTLLTPIKGKWHNGHDTMHEAMIPVRIACEYDQMVEVALMTKAHYRQDSVMYYEISPRVEFV